MPVIKCTKESGGQGYKVEGTSGCPHGTREAAVKQLQAIKARQSEGEEEVEAEEPSPPD